MSERDLNIGGDSTGSVNNTGDHNIILNFSINDPSVTASKIKTALLSAHTKPWEIKGVTLHNLPYPQNPFFTGRESLLEQLHTSLAGTGDTALTQPALAGLGGIGKTQIALEYVYRHIADYKAVFWVKAESETTLTSDYTQIARLLDHPAKDHEDSRVVVEAVQRWLQAHEGWLLVCDNVVKADTLNLFLPTAHKGKVLLTSQASAFGAMANALEITEMEPGEAVAFLLKRCKLDTPSASDIETAGDICSEMGYLPLAIDQAGAFIERTRCGLDKYLQMFREAGLEVLKDKDYPSGHYEKTVATTWSLSIQKVREECPGAEDVLKLSAFLASDDIPLDLFVKGAESLPDPLNSIVASPLEFNRALGTLLAYSLISRRQSAEQFSMHRLVQAVIRDSLDESGKRRWLGYGIDCAGASTPHDMDFSNWSACDLIVPHILSAIEYADNLKVSTSMYAFLLNQAGYYLIDRADYGQAKALYIRALEIREEIFGPIHRNVAASLNNLGMLLLTQGKYEEAEPLLKRALEIKEEIVGTRHPDVAASLNNLGGLYKSQRKFDQAEELYQRAFKILAETEDPSQLAVATCFNNLATLFASQGKYDQAEPLLRRSFDLTEEVLGSVHPTVASALNNLASLYGSQGNYDQAETLFRRALRIDEDAYGPDHPEVATDLNNLGTMLYKTNRKSEGLDMVRRAYAIQSMAFGSSHPYTQSSRSLLESWGGCLE